MREIDQLFRCLTGLRSELCRSGTGHSCYKGMFSEIISDFVGRFSVRLRWTGLKTVLNADLTEYHHIVSITLTVGINTGYLA